MRNFTARRYWTRNVCGGSSAQGKVEVVGIVRSAPVGRRCLDLVGEAKNTGAMDEGERRKWRRLEHDLSVQLQSLGGSSARSMAAIGTHLSPDGIFVQVADPPPEDTRVRVTIGGDEVGSLQLTAEGVVTNQFAPTDASDVTGVGIYFAEAGASWRKLYDLLSQGS